MLAPLDPPMHVPLRDDAMARRQADRDNPISLTNAPLAPHAGGRFTMSVLAPLTFGRSQMRSMPLLLHAICVMASFALIG